MNERLIYRRERAGMTRREVAEKVGISKSYYSSLENGQRDVGNIRVKTALRLADALGCRLEEIL